MRMSALVAAALTLATFTASAQTNAQHPSTVGTWQLDVSKSSFGPQAPPKSITLTIFTDTPQACSWRVDALDENGQSMSYSWSGPQDGSLHPIKDAKGDVMGQESFKHDADGTLLRHGTDNGGNSFDGRASVSDDGNTITDVLKIKTPDGDVVSQTMIYRRVPKGK